MATFDPQEGRRWIGEIKTWVDRLSALMDASAEQQVAVRNAEARLGEVRREVGKAEKSLEAVQANRERAMADAAAAVSAEQARLAKETERARAGLEEIRRRRDEEQGRRTAEVEEWRSRGARLQADYEALKATQRAEHEALVASLEQDVELKRQAIEVAESRLADLERQQRRIIETARTVQTLLPSSS